MTNITRIRQGGRYTSSLHARRCRHRSVFDPVAIEKLRKVAGDEDSTFIAEIAKLFLDEAGKSVEEMRVACDQADWLKVSQIAHSMKSSAASSRVDAALGGVS